MEQFFHYGLSNAAAAALLAMLAAIATRIWRNPHFAYAAWLIVLIRLVAPPLVPVNVPMPAASTLANYGSNLASRAVGLIPTVSRAEKTGTPTNPLVEFDRRHSTNPTATASRPIAHPALINGEPSNSPTEWNRPRTSTPLREVRKAETIAHHQPSDHPVIDRSRVDLPYKQLAGLSNNTQTDEGSGRVADSVLVLLSPLKRLSITQWLTAIWLGGTCCYLLLVCVRAVRFSRALRAERLELSESLRAEAAAAAAVVGLPRLPRMAILAAPLPPFVWPGWRPTVLLPQALVESLSVSQRRLLLLHEFVHLRRLDHRVRWFQIGVVALYWWNPIAWWAARRFERAEEECCDAAVLRLQPDQAEGYGQTLVAVTEFLSTGKLPAPALAIGIVRKNHLKERLALILSGPRWPAVSKTRFAVLATLGAALVALTWRGVTAQNVPTADPVAARLFGGDTKTAVPAHPIPTSDPVVERWFRTGTKTAVVPSNVAPSRADARLASLLKLEPLPPDASDDERQKLLKERYNAALGEVLANQQQSQLGAAPSVDRLCRSARDLFEAELALVTRNRDKLRILERYVDYCNQAWAEVNVRMNHGLSGGGSADESRARAARLDAELRLNEFHAATDTPAPETANAEAAPAHVDEQRLATMLKLESLQPDPGDDELQKLLKERYNAAVRAVKLNQYQYEIGTARAGLLCAATRDLVEAELALVTSRAEKVRILEEYVNQCTRLWKEAEAKLTVGGVTGFSPADEAESRTARYEAEIKLLRLRAEAKEGVSKELGVSSQTPQTNAIQEESRKSSVPLPPTKVASSETHYFNPFQSVKRSAGSPKFLLELMEHRPIALTQGDGEEAKLLKEKYNAAVSAMEIYQKKWQFNTLDLVTEIDGFFDAGRNLRDAELALVRRAEERLGVLETYLDFVRYFEQATDAWVKAGGVPGVDAAAMAARMHNAHVETEAQMRTVEAERRDHELRHPPAFLKTEPASGEAPGDAARQRPVEPELGKTAGGLKQPQLTFQPLAATLPIRSADTATPAPLVFNALPKDAPKGAPALLYAAPLKPEPGDDELRKLLKEKYNAAAGAVQYYRTQFEMGTLTPLGDLLAAGRNVRDAELAFVSDPRQQLPILEAYLHFAKYLADIAHSRLVVGGVVADSPVEAARMREARADAELKLVELRRSLAENAKQTTSAVGGAAPASEGLAGMLQFEMQKPAAEDSRERKQLKERFNAALVDLRRFVGQFHENKATVKSLLNPAQAFTESRLALAERPEEKVRIVAWYHAWTLETWKEVLAKLNAGGETKSNREDESLAREAIFDAKSMADDVRKSLPALLNAKPIEPSSTDDERQKLRVERYNAALRRYLATYSRRQVDPSTPFTNVIAAARQLHVADAARSRGANAVGAHERYLELARFLENQAEFNFKNRSGLIGRDDVEAAHEARLDAEIELLDARGGTAPDPVPAKASGKK